MTAAVSSWQNLIFSLRFFSDTQQHQQQQNVRNASSHNEALSTCFFRVMFYYCLSLLLMVYSYYSCIMVVWRSMPTNRLFF